jgi:hypothetical protein
MLTELKLVTMKTKTQPVDNQQALNKMLAEALKQPGVADVMQLAETADRFSKTADRYGVYIDWQRFPGLSSSCICPEPQMA